MPENKSARDIIDERKLDTVVRLTEALLNHKKVLINMVGSVAEYDKSFIGKEAKIALDMAEKWFGVK